MSRNLIERTVNGETESFIYDNNVVSMSKSGNNYYYLQDELGSQMYNANTGRFQSEDNVKGFMDSTFTLNYYSYCWGIPDIYKDCDGYFPNPISAINMFTNNTVSVINEEFDKASNCCSEHKYVVRIHVE